MSKKLTDTAWKVTGKCVVAIPDPLSLGTVLQGKKWKNAGLAKPIWLAFSASADSEIGYERASLASVSKLLNFALDAGVNVIDTAECYVTSEELVGNTISARRGDYYLFTKCGHERGWSYPDWRPSSLLEIYREKP